MGYLDSWRKESLNIFYCFWNHNIYSLVQIGKLKGKKQKYQKKKKGKVS